MCVCVCVRACVRVIEVVYTYIYIILYVRTYYIVHISMLVWVCILCTCVALNNSFIEFFGMPCQRCSLFICGLCHYRGMKIFCSEYKSFGFQSSVDMRMTTMGTRS